MDSKIANRTSSKRSFAGSIFNKRRVINNLDNVQDALVVLLCIGLLVVMTLLLVNLFSHLQAQPDYRQTISDMLFVLILTELFRLMMIYLESHHISIGVAVEVTLVSVMREVIVEGIIHMTQEQIIGVCAFILAVSVLLYAESVVKEKSSQHPELDRGHGH